MLIDYNIIKMKLVLATLFIALLAFTSASRIVEAEDFIRGVLEGSFGAVGEEVVECIQDGEVIIEDLVHVVEDFEKAIAKGDRSALIEAFGYIADILKELPEEVKECKGVEEFVKDLEKIAAEFANPVELVIEVGEKIIWHGKSIFHDVRATVDDLHQDKYEDAGKDVGDIIKIIFLNGLANPVDDTVDLMTAFYKAAFALKLDLKTCEDDLTVSVDEIIDGVHTILNFTTIQDVYTGALKIYQGGKDLYDGLHECEDAWPIIQEGIVDLKPFADHPAQIFLAVPEAFAMNPIAFPKDAYNFYRALTSHPMKFKQLGSSSGDMVKLTLKHM